eukprot:g15384.t1
MGVPLLPYQEKMVAQLSSHPESCLLLSGAGLGQLRVLEAYLSEILAKELKPRCSDLVFVLNATREEADKIRGNLKRTGTSSTSTSTTSASPSEMSSFETGVFVSADPGPNTRQQAYSRGGIFFCSSRILLGDFLQRRFAHERVFRVVILRAEEVSDVLQKEAFTVQALLRKLPHPDNAVRLLSEDFPRATQKSLEKILHSGGYCRKAFLWPRIQMDVCNSLSSTSQMQTRGGMRGGQEQEEGSGGRNGSSSGKSTTHFIDVTKKMCFVGDRLRRLQQLLVVVCEEVFYALCTRHSPDCLRLLEAEMKPTDPALHGGKPLVRDVSGAFAGSYGCSSSFPRAGGAPAGGGATGSLRRTTTSPATHSQKKKSALLNWLCAEAISDENFTRTLRYKLDDGHLVDSDPHVARLLRDAGQFHALFDRLLKLDCADYHRFLTVLLGKNVFQGKAIVPVIELESDVEDVEAEDGVVAQTTSELRSAARDVGKEAAVAKPKPKAAAEKGAAGAPSISKAATQGRRKKRTGEGAKAAATARLLLGDKAADRALAERFSSTPALSDTDASWLHSEAGREFFGLVRERIVAREASAKWSAVLEILEAEGAGDEEKEKPAASCSTAGEGARMHEESAPPHIMVVCADEREKQQLRSLVRHGIETTLAASFAFLNDPSLKAVVGGGAESRAAEQPTASANINNIGDKNVVSCVTSDELEHAVYEFHPDVVIVMTAEVAAMRLLEVYAASVKDLRENGSLARARAEWVKPLAPLGPVRPTIEPCLPSALFGAAEEERSPKAKRRKTEDASGGKRGSEADDPDVGAGPGLTKQEVRGSISMRCYLLAFADSPELPQYEQALQKETKAVELAVAQKKRLVVDLSTSTRETLAKRPILQIEDIDEATQSTRLGGGRHQRKTEPSQIIVDVRELNSRLPFFLYQRHCLLPATIKIGDYILSRDVCVERKSVYPDLIES